MASPSSFKRRAQVILLSSELSSNNDSPAEIPTSQTGDCWWGERACSDAPTTFTSPDLIGAVMGMRGAFTEGGLLLRTQGKSQSRVPPVAGLFSSRDNDFTSLRPLPQSFVTAKKATELLALFCMCHVGVGFSMGAISPAMETVSKHFQLNDTWRGLLGAAALFGNIFGSPFGGFIADFCGRRVCMLLAWTIFVLASTSQFIAVNIQQLCIARLCLGWSVGAHYSGTTAYLSETLHPNLVDKWLSLVEAHFFIGNFLSLGVGLFLQQVIPNENWRWRISVGSCALPVLIGIFWFLSSAPETPTWLKGHRKSRPEVETESPGECILLPVELLGSNETDTRHQHSTATLETSTLRSTSPETSKLELVRSIVFVSIFWGTLIIPTYAVSAFAVFIIHNLELHIDAFQLNMYLGAAAVVGVFVGFLLIDHIGRKRLLLLSQWGVAVALGALGYCKPSIFEGKQNSAVATLLVFSFLAFEILNGAGAPLALVYPAEIFPNRFRGLASGISGMNSRILAVTAIFLMSLALSRLGVSWTLLGLAILSALGAIITHIMAPEETDDANSTSKAESCITNHIESV